MHAKEIINKWIELLESGKYNQIYNKYTDYEMGRCALGLIYDTPEGNKLPQQKVYNSLAGCNLMENGIRIRYMGELKAIVIKLNDSGYSFSDIADFLRGNSQVILEEGEYVLKPLDEQVVTFGSEDK